MKTIFTLMFAVVLNGLSFGQYLSFKEFKGLLDVANSETKVEKYLKDRGFEKSSDNKLDEEKGIKYLYYSKKSGKKTQFVTVLQSVKGNNHLVRESSKDKKRWEYYKDIARGNGFKEVETISPTKSESSTRYRNKELELTIAKSQGLDGTFYTINLSKF